MLRIYGERTLPFTGTEPSEQVSFRLPAAGRILKQSGQREAVPPPSLWDTGAARVLPPSSPGPLLPGPVPECRRVVALSLVCAGCKMEFGRLDGS